MNGDDQGPVALVTGAARRIGAAIARRLHADGYRVLVHHATSRTEAQAMVDEFNGLRDDSASALAADLRARDAGPALASDAMAVWGRVDVVVNNASTFFATPLGTGKADEWDTLFDVNARAPWFLVQALAGELRRRRGAVVNIVDIYADRPLADHGPYCAAKAALVSLTASLARDLAPEARVNAVAPGAILWPGNGGDDAARGDIIARTPLARLGEPADIADTVTFLLRPGSFITGQIIRVDGGRGIVP